MLRNETSLEQTITPPIEKLQKYVTVSELVGRVRNVVLINVYLDLENPGGSGFRVGGYMSQVRGWGS